MQTTTLFLFRSKVSSKTRAVVKYTLIFLIAFATSTGFSQKTNQKNLEAKRTALKKKLKK